MSWHAVFELRKKSTGEWIETIADRPASSSFLVHLGFPIRMTGEDFENNVTRDNCFDKSMDGEQRKIRSKLGERETEYTLRFFYTEYEEIISEAEEEFRFHDRCIAEKKEEAEAYLKVMTEAKTELAYDKAKEDYLQALVEIRNLQTDEYEWEDAKWLKETAEHCRDRKLGEDEFICFSYE